MDFRGLVWKRVWKITFFGLKSGQYLKNRELHPHQEFPGVPPSPREGDLYEVMQNRECIAFERTCETKQKIHEQCACSESRVQPMVGWIQLQHTIRVYSYRRDLLAGIFKTKYIRKLSNFNFQWTKNLYQNNLKSIAFFFTFFKG